MASPVKLYQQEMHKNVGFFATWLPSSAIELGDFGVLEGGRFRRIGSLKELGIPSSEVREGTPENMTYAASADRKAGASVEASGAVPVAQGELSIRFSRQGGYVFEAASIRSIEIANRLELAERILDVYKQQRWQREWLLVDAMYIASAATVIVSEDNSSEIVLKASSNAPLGALPLADPKLGLTVTSSTGKIVHVIAQSNLKPLYSCLRVRDPIIGSPSVEPVRGIAQQSRQPLARPGIDELLES